MNVWKLLKRLGIFAICIIAALAALPASANTVPPTFAFHYYGDANGDMLIDVSDISQIRLFTLGLPYIYDTLQPQNGTQDWNTSDLTSDRILDVSDISLAKMWTLGFQLSIPDKPWTLSNYNLPLTGNPAGVFVPFQANLTSTSDSLPSGRPGITVKAEIDAAHSTVTGSLSGRTCTPVEGSRDQAALTGAQCALSVTQTDWGAHTDQGLTETGAYGFALKADGLGTVRVVLSMAGNVSMDMPALTVGVAATFTTRVWFVKYDATGSNNGTSWTDAFTVVKNGMNAAASGDMVWVARGTYTNTSGYATNEVLLMKAGVQTYGGFAGTETGLSQRNIAANPTILDGENKSNHVVIGASNSRLDGFTATRGFVPNSGGGGGMYNVSVTGLLVTNCIFKLNNTLNGMFGGGMYNDGSSLTITNCTFNNNYVNISGGGLYSNSSSGAISNCLFAGNSLLGGSGGGMAIRGSSSPTITDCVFVSNSANSGGAISTVASTVISNCSFIANRSNYGGGVYTDTGGYAIITKCIFSGNSASQSIPPEGQGGAISFLMGGGTVTNSIFIGNTAQYMGGAIGDGGYSITNCTFSGNSAANGGAVAMHNGFIINSILWGDSASSGSEIFPNFPPGPSVSYSDVQGGWSGPGGNNINLNPLFLGNPAYSGTWTAASVTDSATFKTTYTDSTKSWTPSSLKGLFINPSTSQSKRYLIVDNTATTVTAWGSQTAAIGAGYQIFDYHIGSASPCTNAGTSSGAPSSDLDGNPRPSPVAGAFDMGAYEYQWQ